MQIDQQPGQGAGPQHARNAQYSFLSRLAADLHTSAIAAKCTCIDSYPQGAPVIARETLSRYLIDHKVNNTGELSDRQRQLCAWTLLEHQARNPGTQQPVSLSQLASYIKPGEAMYFADLARAMSVRIDSLAP